MRNVDISQQIYVRYSEDHFHSNIGTDYHSNKILDNEFYTINECIQDYSSNHLLMFAANLFSTANECK